MFETTSSCVQERYCTEAQFSVLKGSRDTEDGQYKHSYHLVSRDIAFASNGSDMKKLLEDFVRANLNDTVLTYVDARDGKTKSIIDTAVYTKNRAFRTQLSHKRSDPTKTMLQLIERTVTSEHTDNQGNTISVCQWKQCNNTTKDQLMQAFITHIPEDLKPGIIPSSSSISQLLGAKRPLAVAAEARDSKRQAVAADTSELPHHALIMAQVQKMVDDRGGSGCRISSLKMLDSSTMHLSCKNSCQRTCLVTKGLIHKNNNAYITVSKDMRVTYGCHSQKCKGKAEVIGVLQDDELICEAARELALMGPPNSVIDAQFVLINAQMVNCVEHWLSDDLTSAVSEWLSRSMLPQLQGATGKLLVEIMMNYLWKRQSVGLSVQQRLDALSELRSRRLKHCVIRFKPDVVSCSLDGCITVTSFLQNVDVQATDVCSLVLIVRLLWPDSDAKDAMYEFIQYNLMEKQACCLDDKIKFDAVWKTKHCFKTETFKTIIEQHLKTSLQSHPFVRDVIRRVMGMPVLRYWKQEDELQFTLDDGNVPSTKVQYRLNFFTGEIAGSRGTGIVHCLFGMKPFFTNNGNVKLMAEILATLIKRKMLRDSKEGKWRIYDQLNGIWKLPCSEFEPHSIVGDFVRQELEPIRQLELFLGVPFAWTSTSAASTATDDDTEADTSLEQVCWQFSSSRLITMRPTNEEHIDPTE
jgi:hypothetical protein